MSELLNAEKLIADHLRGVEALDALGVRAVAKTPEKTDAPWVKITQIDAPDDPDGAIERAIDYYLQLDIYAGKDGGQPEATRINGLVRASLKALQDSTLAGTAVVSRVRFVSNPRVPDTDFEPARERFVLDGRLKMRPV